MDKEPSERGDMSDMAWPARGMKLFTSDPPGKTLAWLSPSREAYIVSEGYVMAADLMVERIQSKPPGDIDFLIWPIVFCYRQAIELELKEALVVARRLTRSGKGFKAGHDLCKLWSALETELTGLSVVVERAEEISVLDSLIDEFHDKDPQSFHFRYTRDTEGRALRNEQERIQLTVLANGCRAIRNWLSGLIDWLGALEDAQP